MPEDSLYFRATAENPRVWPKSYWLDFVHHVDRLIYDRRRFSRADSAAEVDNDQPAQMDKNAACNGAKLARYAASGISSFVFPR